MTTEKALEGIRVLDLGQIYAGPYAGFLLAMAGADVIKIEPPQGEFLRARAAVSGGIIPFAMLNANKRSATLNLKEPRGRELLLRMVREADILLENYGADTLLRLGLGWEVLHAANPRLVYASLTGYGRSGPYRDYPAMDLTIQAMAGIMSVTGFQDRPPVKAGPAIVDFMGGANLYAAILTALFQRERTGRGQQVEISLQEAIYPALSSNLGLLFAGKGTQRTGNRHGGLASSPYNVYPTNDGYLAIICIAEHQWRSLTKVMGQPELANDPRFATLKDRVRNMDELDALIGAWSSSLTKEEAFKRLILEDVPAAPVRDLDEVINDPHMHSRGMLHHVDHPQFGKLVLPSSPLKLQDSPHPPRQESAQLGSHNREIYADWLGLSPEQIETLNAEGVI
ncbi:MAG: CaiB/BaiF CoA transferase family protein [Burkholderiales bacterium]